MLGKEEVIRMLDESGIKYDIYEHSPVYTVEEALQVDMPFNEYGLKNLFLKDKKNNYYIYSLPGEKKADLKELKKYLGVSNLHFASEEELLDVTGLHKGHVTPLGALNSGDYSLKVVFDSELSGLPAGIHPMTNDATLFLSFDELYTFLKDNKVDIIMYNDNITKTG